jgi:hypothetical protein
MNVENFQVSQIFRTFLLMLRSRKFWLAVASLITLWAGPEPIEGKISTTVLILMGLAGLIAYEDAAEKRGDN